jgi:hypothetical protein
MVEIRTNLALADTGTLMAGHRYALPPGLEVALVREGLAVFVDNPEAPPQVQALAGPPARKRGAVVETRA